MLFGSLVKLHTWLHSYLCFSPLKKLFLKSWLDTSLIASYLLSFLSFFSYRNLDSTSTPDGSIEKVFDLSTTPQHRVDRSSIMSCFWCFSSSTASWHMICRRCFFLTPARQMSRHHLDTSFVENYWWSINSPRAIRSSLLSISLSILQTFHLPNLSHSLQTSSLGILKLSSSLSSLGKLLIYFIYIHFMFWNLGFGIFFKKNLGFFQNWWDIVEILG